jgi:hypothetical protein
MFRPAAALGPSHHTTLRCHDGDVFREGLGDDLAIERIGMMRGQIEQAEGVLRRVRQDPQP